VVKVYAEADYYQKKGNRRPWNAEGEKPCKKVLKAVRAIEMNMVLSCIAMGILWEWSLVVLTYFG